MPRPVIFRRYGGPEVLEIVDVPRPKALPGQFLVRVVATALNPGEAHIREGEFVARWPAHFPELQGNDFAGTVAEIGDGARGFAIGDHVIGFAPRTAQADFVVVVPDSLTAKPAELSWSEAACIAGATNFDLLRSLGVEPVLHGLGLPLPNTHRRTDAQTQASSPAVWSRIAKLITAELLTIPIVEEYPLEEAARAYHDVASRHGFGKRILKVAVGE